MSQLKLLLEVALRNLLARRVNRVIGGIIFVGTLVVVVGGSMLDSMDEALRRSIIGSLAGHLQVYSASSQDELALFGDLGQEAELSALEDFSRVKAALLSHPNVKTVVPMGINAAFISTGNTADRALERLRALYRQREEKGDTPELSEQRANLKAHVRQLVALLQQDHERNRAFINDANVDPLEKEALEKARSEEFWASFDQDAFGALEFLENRIAPQMADGDLLYLRYVGTDVAAFQQNFDRMRIVDGTAVPPGQRGMLLSKLFYEETLKLKAAYRMDLLKRARETTHYTLDNSARMQRLLENNRNQTREILYQLDPQKLALMRERLQRILNSQEQDVEKLLRAFFTMDDAAFEQRYTQFYSELAPLVELYRLKPGDTLSITGFTHSGYMQSVNVRIYGTYEFQGLEQSSVAGSFSLMDIMTFRDLYGFVTADMREELKQLRQTSGAKDVPRESAEAELFGGSSTLEAKGVARKIDEDSRLQGHV
ncbi:MAG: ABC transporter permease, partial [Hyalangium sp.]|uniref:ABC transporter permease n=1 Tax=Hyalangium sp. TaxID=2028555 RepID=UPI00389A45B9